MRHAGGAPVLRRKVTSGISAMKIIGSNSSSFSIKARMGIISLFFAIYLFRVIKFVRNPPDLSKNENNELKERYLNKFFIHYNNDNHRNATREQHATFETEPNKDDVPIGIWPIPSTITNNNSNEFDMITHPGDLVTKMQVPKFWSLPIHRNKSMTYEIAMKIGICTTSDSDGNFVRGESCPVNNRTIFVAIASYRDFQCRHTVESIFLRAEYPQRIRVTVVDQIIPDEDPHCSTPIEACETNPNQALCLYKNQIDVFTMDAKLGVGPVFARHIGNRMYRGEYYATQIDAHVTCVQDWDVDIISQFEATNNEMAVLSTYSTDVQGSIDDTTGKSKRKTRPIMCNTDFEGGSQSRYLRHGSQPEARPVIKGMPQLQPWWAAGYSFSRGHFIVNVPYDAYQPFIFQGEEMSIGIRGFTIGYDYYAPERSICFHHYSIGDNAKLRSKVKKFWENSKLYPNWKASEKKSMARLLGIVHMNPEVDTHFWDHTEQNIYGIGGTRQPEQFYRIFGIDVVNKTVEKHLCKFVEFRARMHKEFLLHLREKGEKSKIMGIDYSNITFRFKDPAPTEKRK